MYANGFCFYFLSVAVAWLPGLSQTHSTCSPTYLQAKIYAIFHHFIFVSDCVFEGLNNNHIYFHTISNEYNNNNGSVLPKIAHFQSFSAGPNAYVCCACVRIDDFLPHQKKRKCHISIINFDKGSYLSSLWKVVCRALLLRLYSVHLAMHAPFDFRLH